MQGRYHYWRLDPFTLREISDMTGQTGGVLARLFERGGFPEPYLAATDRAKKRWQRSRLERVIREDIFALESLRDLNSMFYLHDLLVERVGSPISLQALAEDIGVSPITISNWIRVLEAMYAIFIVTPYHRKLSRAIKNETDFLVTVSGELDILAEAKFSDKSLSKGLLHYARKLKPRKAYQVIYDFEGLKESKDADLLAAEDFFLQLK